MVEIGVWRGQNAHAILSAHPHVCMALIDPYRAAGYGDAYHLTGSKDSRTNQVEFDRVCAQAHAYLAPFADRVLWYRHASTDAYCDWWAPISLVFIDGDHSYDGCKSDIAVWRDKVRAGGWLGGHDYDHPRFPGVLRAVNEAFPDGVIRGADHTWWVRT